MRTFARTLTVTTLTVALATPAAEAVAGPPNGSDPYGQHVAACAQGGELGANHNPGMHQGASGWDGQSCG